MDFETVSPDEFGRSLRGNGVNLLVKDIDRSAAFLTTVFDAKIFQPSKDFAIATLSGGNVVQLHSDGAYHSHDLPSLIPESGPRGGGVEIRLFECDPDQSVVRAQKADYYVFAEPKDKPHGLREAYILDPDGYAWVPSRPLA